MINEPDKVDLEGIISGYTMEMMFIVARRPHARANTGHTFLIPKGSLHKKKMPQSGVGSMQGKNTGNMPSAVFASSMNKSLDPTPI